MKFFLGMFLASEAMMLVQSVDNIQRVSTRKLAKYGKRQPPCTDEVGELKETIDLLQDTNSVLQQENRNVKQENSNVKQENGSLKKDIDVLQKQCAPAVNPNTKPIPGPITEPVTVLNTGPDTEPDIEQIIRPIMTEKGVDEVITELAIDRNTDGDSLLKGGSPKKFAIPSTNRLLEGFSIVYQGQGGTPFMEIYPCEDAPDYDTRACIESVKSAGGSNDFQSMLYDKQSREDFMKTVVSAEGGSVGFQVSASVDYMQSSKISLETVSYTVGGTLIDHDERIRNLGQLKLTGIAKETLRKSPKLFIQNYGLSFVYSITYGGSFLGSFDMTAKKSSAQSELNAEVSAKYTGGVYSAEGSVEFQKKRKEENSNIDIASSWKAKPEPKGPRPSLDEPSVLMDVYKKWSESALDNASPLYLFVTNWFVSEEIQEIVGDLDFSSNDMKQWRKALQGNAVNISPRTMELASTERINTDLLVKTLKTFLGYEEVKRYKSKVLAFYNDLEKLLADADQYYQLYTSGQVFDDTSLIQLDRQLLERKDDLKDIRDSGNPFGTWKLFSQKDGLQERFESNILPQFEQLLKTVRSVRCRDDDDDEDMYIVGKNGLVNGFGDHDELFCPDYTVCRDDTDLVEDKNKICLPVWRCEKAPTTLAGNGDNCFFHATKGLSCQCPSNAYCDPAISAFDTERTNMCKECVVKDKISMNCRNEY